MSGNEFSCTIMTTILVAHVKSVYGYFILYSCTAILGLQLNPATRDAAFAHVCNRIIVIFASYICEWNDGFTINDLMSARGAL